MVLQIVTWPGLEKIKKQTHFNFFMMDAMPIGRRSGNNNKKIILCDKIHVKNFIYSVFEMHIKVSGKTTKIWLLAWVIHLSNTYWELLCSRNDYRAGATAIHQTVKSTYPMDAYILKVVKATSK